MAGGGLLKAAAKAAAKAAKAAKPTLKAVQDVLPAAEREENLQKFLGNSRIRDRLYHATPKNFKQFKPGGEDPKLSGPAIWLSPNAESQPAAHNIGGGSRGFKEGTNVMPVYAQARSPLLLDDKLSIDWAREVYANGDREFPDLIAPETIEELKKGGYDSIIHADPYGTRGGEQEIIMFDPNRIKSAIGNRGTYDTNEPDLNKAGGGLVHLAGGGDPRKRGLFPKMPMQAIVNSPGFDPTVPDAFGNAYQRRIAEKEKYERETKDQKLTPAQRAVAGLEATGMLGSAMFEGVQQLPKLLDGEEAYTKAVGEGMYQPRFQPEKAAEYVGNVGDFLEKLETEYKMPALTPELLPFIGAAEAAKQQSKRAVKQGALTAASRMDAGPKAGSMAAQRGVIKMPGGNFLTGSVEGALKPLLRAENLDNPEQAKALNKWVSGNLTNYVKKQMGTAEDPVRKLADKGILHMNEPQGGNLRASATRKMLGLDPNPTSETPLGQAWENRSDSALMGAPYRMHLPMVTSQDEATEALRALGGDYAAANPNALAFAWDRGADARNLGFDHIVDVLKQDLAEGRIRPEQLNKVSMEQAVRRAYEYDQEMAKKMAATQAKVTEGMPVHKEYPEGYKWIELVAPKPELEPGHVMGRPSGYPDLHAVIDEKTGQSVSIGATPEEAIKLYKREEREKNLGSALKYEGDTMGHCVGGYCPDVIEGRSRIYSLRDAKGEPHVTVEVKPHEGWFTKADKMPDPSGKNKSFHELIDNERSELAQQKGGYGNIGESYEDTANRLANQYQLKSKPAIQQIKGKGNRAPKEDYLPFVQDFVKSGNWSDVNELRNAGLRATSDAFNETEQAFLKSKGVELKPYIDPEETARYQELFKQTPPEQGMAGGGLIGKLSKAAKAAEKVMPTARIGLEAPGIIIPSKVSNVKEAVRQSKGDFGARRVERAADEIPNLEQMYREEALRQAFTGDNAKGLMTINPSDFERYATPLMPREKPWPGTGPKKENLPTDEYVNYLAGIDEYHDVPFLEINKQEYGLPLVPFISGHEGRHRNRAMAKRGEKAGLVQLLPRSELREPFPRRSQEEYLQALRDELEMTGNVVVPQPNIFTPSASERPAIELPDVYAKGGKVSGLRNALNNLLRTDKPEVHMALGGATNAAKIAAKAAEKAAKAAAKVEHPLVFPRAVPKSLEEIRPIAQRMAEQMTGEFVKQNPKVTTNPAGKSRKQFEREKSIPLETRNVVPERAAPDVNYEDYMGYGLVGVPGDPTLGGVAKRGSLEEVAQPTVELTRVGDITPDYPVPLFGGPRYGDDEKFWASNFGAAVPIQKNASKLADEYQSPIIAKYIKMGSGSENFALHNLDALLAIQRPERLDKDKMARLTEVIQAGSPKYGKFPGFTGFEEPIDVLLQAQMDSNLRKHIAETLTKPTITNELGLPNGLDVVAAITHPELRDLETGASGFSVGKMKPSAELQRGESSHPTYDTDIPGSFLGRSKYPTPYEIAFPDTTAYARSQMTPGVQEFNMMKMLGPRERIDQQYIDEIKMYEELMKKYTGKKKGGLAQTKKVKRHGNTVPN
jgi:hypothetical protein